VSKAIDFHFLSYTLPRYMVQSASSNSLQLSAIAAAEWMLVLLLPEVGAEKIDLKKLTMFMWECCIHSGFRSVTMVRYAWN